MAPGPDADLEDVAPACTRSCTPSAVTMLPAAIGMPRSSVGTARSAREHALLVAVRGVEHEHVDAGGGERPRLRGDVAVDADGGGDAEPARRVDARGGRACERSALRRESVPTRWPWCSTQTRLGVGGDDQVERVRGALDVVGVDAMPRARARGRRGGRRAARCPAASPGRPRGCRRCAARRAGLGHDDAVALGGRQQPRSVGDGGVGREDERACPTAPAGP